MINSPQQYLDSAWNWDFLKGCFPNPRVRFSDIDGTVEVNGYFLYLECKAPGVEMPVGQAIAFERRIEDGRSTVIYVWGEPELPEAFQVLGAMKEPQPCDVDQLVNTIREWSAWADSQPRPEALPPCWPVPEHVATRSSRSPAGKAPHSSAFTRVPGRCRSVYTPPGRLPVKPEGTGRSTPPVGREDSVPSWRRRHDQESLEPRKSVHPDPGRGWRAHVASSGG